MKYLCRSMQNGELLGCASFPSIPVIIGSLAAIVIILHRIFSFENDVAILNYLSSKKRNFAQFYPNC